jgi:hypothetical protein
VRLGGPRGPAADPIQGAPEVCLVDVGQLRGQPPGEGSTGRHDKSSRDGAGDPAQQAPILFRLALLQVLGELALEGAPDLLAVAAERAQRLIDFPGQEGRRQRFRLAPQSATHPADDFQRTTEGEEPGAGCQAGRPGRVAPDLGLDINGRPTGGLQASKLAGERLAGRYDFGPSGLCFRTHSIVSFVVSTVSRG